MKTSFSNISTVIRVCLDTNVFISAAIFGGKCDDIVELVVQKKIQNVISFHIISEIAIVLDRKFKRTEQEIKDVLTPIVSISKMVKILNKLKVLPYDPDNRILECAVAGKVDYLVTGDKKHLLKLKEYEGIKILSPGQFLKAIAIGK